MCSSDLGRGVDFECLVEFDSGKTSGCNLVEVGAANHEEARSEERRVGKECRSRWSPYH